jgi:hypothetical protein
MKSGMKNGIETNRRQEFPRLLLNHEALLYNAYSRTSLKQNPGWSGKNRNP